MTATEVHAGAAPCLILASASVARARLLTQGGLRFETMPAAVDEETVKDAMLGAGAAPAQIAEALAELKALRVGSLVPAEAFVLGSDQVLVAEDALYSKPNSLAEARAQLLALRGKPHQLITAAVVARGGAVIWRHVARATLHMRDFSPAFLDWYMDRIKERALLSVGCYEIEGLGVQLFSQIDGDPYTIQGLPLLPLLAYLREHGLVMA